MPAEPARSGWERETLEKLALATLREQQTARRWKNGLRVAWLLFVVVAFWMAWSYNAPTASPSTPHTAMVAIKGEIASEGDASAENVMAAMRSALEDSGSRALVLLINSPGGSPVQAGLINDEIHRLKNSTTSPSTWWSRSLVLRRPITSPRSPTAHREAETAKAHRG